MLTHIHANYIIYIEVYLCIYICIYMCIYIYVYCLLEMISKVGCLLHVDDQKSPQPKVFSSSRNIIWHGLSLTNNHVGSWAAPDGYRERKMGHHPQSRTKIAHACVFPKQNQANNIRHHNFMLHLRFFLRLPVFFSTKNCMESPFFCEDWYFHIPPIEEDVGRLDVTMKGLWGSHR